MSVELLSAGSGALLSLAFAYLPGLNARYEALDGVYKRLIMLVLLAVVAVGSLAIACAGFAPQFELEGVVCDQAGAVELLRVFFAAVVANQTAFLVAPKK